MAKSRLPQQYSPEEFDAAVKLIQSNTDLRADIEAITGQKIADLTPRQIFDWYRAIERATDIQLAVAKYGRARQVVRETRAALEGTANAERGLEVARARIAELERRCAELKAQRDQLKAANVALAGGKVTPLTRPVIRGEVAS